MPFALNNNKKVVKGLSYYFEPRLEIFLRTSLETSLSWDIETFSSELRQKLTYDPVRFKSDPVSFKSNPVSFKSDPLSIKSDPVSFKSDPVSFKSDPLSIKCDQTIIMSHIARNQLIYQPESETYNPDKMD